MNRKTRKIDNSEWITNIFLDENNIYFTDSLPNKTNNFLCYISKENFNENLKNKADIQRTFLSHPSPLVSSLEDISKTDIEVLKVSKYYIQNFVSIEGIEYISFIKNNQVFTNILNSELEAKQLQIIKKIGNRLVIKKEDGIWLTDHFLKSIKKINYDIVDIIKLKTKYVIQTSKEELIVLDENFNFEKNILTKQGFKKIYYINQNNILISYKELNITNIYNIFTDKDELFDNSFINRAILLGENLLLSKKIENSTKSDLLNLIY
ncbi:hypothetical protein [Spiroplasma cantharicola]|uniref:hypothetical protein n=1 Tax=Spiroplasma cantharicola TaxID=362837 RepID=UPI0006B4EEDF|nr:hypothetical protein [Spiroplasma cantharicola]